MSVKNRMHRVNHEMLQDKELTVLQEEERVVQALLEKYESALHKLQVEELTIKSQLSHARKVDLGSHNGTSVGSFQGSNTSIDNSSYVGNREVAGGMFPKQTKPGLSMSELQINQSSLNLGAAPLIQRMLHDTDVYEEEEEEEEEDEDEE